MKDSRKSIDQLNQKLDKQIIDDLKQKALKGGTHGYCPPPWPYD